MKFLDPELFCQLETSAPALNRGLAVLSILEKQVSLSLDALTEQLELPKSSVFRLLGTLQQLGVVQKMPDRKYKALWSLQPVIDAPTRYRQKIEKRLAPLCKNTGCTVEWYEPDIEGMRLIRQENPDAELRVQLSPNSLRRWGQEFEAIARLGYAFANEAPSLEAMPMYIANGELKKQTLKTLKKWLKEAQESKIAYDVLYNANGVRRYAAAAIKDGYFYGIIALAEAFHFTPSRHTSPAAFMEQLQDCLDFSSEQLS